MSSLIFNVLTRLYNFLIMLILYFITKHNGLAQSEQQNWSYSISQLVNFWFDKSSPPSEVMYFCESCWTIFQYLYALFLIYLFPFVDVYGYNFLCWHIYVCYQQDMSYFLMLCTLFIYFSIGFIVSNFFVHPHQPK